MQNNSNTTSGSGSGSSGHFKRETSISVSELHVQTVSDNIKRLAISVNGHPSPSTSHTRESTHAFGLDSAEYIHPFVSVPSIGSLNSNNSRTSETMFPTPPNTNTNVNNVNGVPPAAPPSLPGSPSKFALSIKHPDTLPHSSRSHNTQQSDSGSSSSHHTTASHNPHNPHTTHHTHNTHNPSSSSQSILSVLSSARDDFNSRYEILREIGKGGFSVVYECRERGTGAVYAVKVVDLRPLRLRERFNPARLKREVDIMRRLDHPNIIKFIEVYEDADHLMMVMEYCPGQELFDVILARKCFTEEDAKPIFFQVTRALYYMHSMNILHRDIKPENILILHQRDPHTGQCIAKLLDFGLSKNAGAGSVAKTFVGTPCYLAPEVELTSKGQGGTYGLAADCWSLGAVLYVMLVARFPEFEMDASGKVVVKLPANLWNNISAEAKDLIRGLMNTSPHDRMTTQAALRHPWLGQWRMSEKALAEIAVRTSDFGHRLQEEEEESGAGRAEEETELSATGMRIQHTAMVVRQQDPRTHAHNAHAPVPAHGAATTTAELKLAPLLHLQRSIATCFEEAHKQHEEFPEVAAAVRRGAVLCRQQLVESTKMLRKVEQTAKEVLEMFPDLELAIEEDEPQLAADFFEVVKGWVAELREQVASTQKINKASMSQIQKVVEQSSAGLQERHKQLRQQQQQAQANTHKPLIISKQLLEDFVEKLSVDIAHVNNNNNAGSGNSSSERDSSHKPLDANQVLELFYALFSAQHVHSHSSRHAQTFRGQQRITDVSANVTDSDAHVHPQSSRVAELDSMEVEVSDVSPSTSPVPRGEGTETRTFEYSVQSPSEKVPSTHTHTQSHAHSLSQSQSGRSTVSQLTVETENQRLITQQEAFEIQLDDGPSPRATSRLGEALHKLEEVDKILEELNVFWANTEIVLDLLTKKGQHVEQFIGFASKPRLMARFRERMEEYKRFWENVRMMCANYITGIDASNNEQKMYGFLEKNRTVDSAGSINSSTKEESFEL